MNRLLQVTKYGWKHAGEAAVRSNRNRLILFFDILLCYIKYRMWSNQYLKERFYELAVSKRDTIGRQFREDGIGRDEWQKDFRDNRKFLLKYSSKRYELAALREKRTKAYARRFNAGTHLMVEYDVNISRQHYLNGSIKIGNNVLLAKHVFIDYSGNVEIGDNVQLTNGVIIETHFHPFHSDYTKSRGLVEPTSLKIEEGAVIGSRAIIMPSCHRIGKHARVGAGAVVTKDVPDFAVVVGVPAKIIRMQNNNSHITI